MEEFKNYLSSIQDQLKRDRMKKLLHWISESYPFLEKRSAWNQPNFVNKGTFILGISHSKEHIAIAPEKVAVDKFKESAHQKGFSTSQQLIKIQWNQEIDYPLIKEIIDFNIEDKQGVQTYWRK